MTRYVHACILPPCPGDCEIYRCACGRVWIHFCNEDGCEWQEESAA